MSTSILIAVVAVALSFITFIINVWLGHRAAVRARKPVLVFVWGESGWTLRNIGNGPALNVLMALREPDEWFNPVRVPPLAKDASLECSWLEAANVLGLGVEYTDSEGRWYTSTTGDDNTVVSAGRWLPEWERDQIGRHWSTPAYSPYGSRWGVKASSFPAGVRPAAGRASRRGLITRGSRS